MNKNTSAMAEKPRLTIIAAVLMLACLSSTSAQFSNTYYHMFMVPQANQLNPAFQPVCNTYLGLPVLSSFRFDLELPVAYSDVFTYSSSLDQFLPPFHEEGDKQAFLDALGKNSTFRVETGLPFFSTGWRKENMFFSLDITNRMDFGMTLPADMAGFLLDGVEADNPDRLSFSGFGPELKLYNEFALGVSYNNDDEFQLGVRGKLLFGMVNLRRAESDINLKTDVDEWEIQSNIRYNATIPFLDNLPIDSDGTLLIDSIGNMDEEDLFSFPADPMDLLRTPDGRRTAMGFKNPGLALDFGFSYRPIEQLSISASAVDLGVIFWRKEAWQFSQEMDYTFGGLELSLNEDVDYGEELLDSLKNSVKFTAAKKSYTTLLTGKVYYGLAYEPHEKVRLGFVGRTRIYDYNFNHQFTFSANVMPISMFSASVSYSIYNGTYHNLGLGMFMRLGPFSLYFITDQAPSVYLLPQTINSMNFRLGLNIVTGCRKESRKMKDRPLID